MIQFNLLPDSKLQVVKARRLQRMILLGSIIATASAIVILLISVAAVGVQKYSLKTAADDVAKYTNQLENSANFNDILTIQNQLTTVVGLHKQEPVVTRLFDYLPQITPTKAGIGQLQLDFVKNTIILSGTANTLQTVNQFADTLKFTTYSVDNQTQSQAAFPSVVLSSFTRSSSNTNYTLTLTFDPALFDQSKNVKLVVPQNYISTQSFLKLPNSSLFTGSPTGASQ